MAYQVVYAQLMTRLLYKMNKKATLKISTNKIIYITKPTRRCSSAPSTDLYDHRSKFVHICQLIHSLIATRLLRRHSLRARKRDTSI